jgi:ATP-binding cassette, subfamily G (WHITE), member 2, SNQ2
VLLLDEGRRVYFGPTSEARAYFENLGYKSLPRQSTADYLTGCTDPNERQFAPGRSASNTPSTPESLENAFLYSHLARNVDDSLSKFKTLMSTDKSDQDAFRAAVIADKKRGVSKKSPYTIGFVAQVKALTIRQFQMRLQDKFQLATSFSLSCVLPLVLGGAYFNQPLTAAGAFTRGGVIFAGMLSVCLGTEFCSWLPWVIADMDLCDYRGYRRGWYAHRFCSRHAHVFSRCQTKWSHDPLYRDKYVLSYAFCARLTPTWSYR